jgi:hypothetical protein
MAKGKQIMEWMQFAIFLITVLGFFWATRSDMNSYRAEAAADRRDILGLIRSIEQEMKDFHGRLERQDAEFKAHLMHHHKE